MHSCLRSCLYAVHSFYRQSNSFIGKFGWFLFGQHNKSFRLIALIPIAIYYRLSLLACVITVAGCGLW
jgi:hypothetical protein